MPTILSKAALGAIALFALWKAYQAVKFLLRPRSSPLRDLPGPASWNLLLGNIRNIQKGRNSSVQKDWVTKYGSTFTYKVLFNSDRVFTVDTKALNHILFHSVDYQKPEATRFNLSRLLGAGLLVTEGDKHRQQRRIMNPSFSPASIKALTPIFFQKSIQLRDLWAKEIRQIDRQKMNVIPWLSRATLDIIGLAGFNYKFDALSQATSNELSGALSTIFNAGRPSLIPVLAQYFPVIRHIPSVRARRQAEAMKNMRRIGKALVKERKGAILGEKAQTESEHQNNDLLSALIRANMDPELTISQQMSDEDVLAQIPTFFVAGHETTSTETVWALHALSQKPEVQKRLRQELLSVPTDYPSMDELMALPYLDAVVRETMRVHPAVPSTMRVAMKDDVIPLNKPYIGKDGTEKHFIPVTKGDWFFIPISVLNTTRDIWGADGEEFRPERWSNLPEAASSVPGVWGNVMTFLTGARGCIGYRFAVVEMKALLFTLIRAFEFEATLKEEDIETREMVVRRPYVRSTVDKGAQMPLRITPYRGDIESESK